MGEEKTGEKKKTKKKKTKKKKSKKEKKRESEKKTNSKKKKNKKKKTNNKMKKHGITKGIGKRSLTQQTGVKLSLSTCVSFQGLLQTYHTKANGRRCQR